MEVVDPQGRDGQNLAISWVDAVVDAPCRAMVNCVVNPYRKSSLGGSLGKLRLRGQQKAPSTVCTRPGSNSGEPV